MTDTQFLILLATVWIAPQGNPYCNLFIGSSILLVTAGRGLGFI